MINRVVLVGRLTKDIELRYTAKGKAVVQFILAINRPFTNSNGDREADFVNCVIWGKPAVNFEKYTQKGSLVGIDGRVQTRHYDPKDGGKRVYITEVIAENFSFLESKAESDQRKKNNDGAVPQQSNDVNEPFDYDYDHKNKIDSTTDPFKADNSKPIDISDDDLPF